jgi:hypothetical protein
VFSGEEIDEVKRGFGQTRDLAGSPLGMLPEILQLRQQGKSLCEICRLLGFTHQAIGRALRRWKGAYVLGNSSQTDSYRHSAANKVQQDQG